MLKSRYYQQVANGDVRTEENRIHEVLTGKK